MVILLEYDQLLNSLNILVLLYEVISDHIYQEHFYLSIKKKLLSASYVKRKEHAALPKISENYSEIGHTQPRKLPTIGICPLTHNFRISAPKWVKLLNILPV